MIPGRKNLKATAFYCGLLLLSAVLFQNCSKTTIDTKKKHVGSDPAADASDSDETSSTKKKASKDSANQTDDDGVAENNTDNTTTENSSPPANAYGNEPTGLLIQRGYERLTISWQDGGGLTSGFYIAYKAGSEAPEDCKKAISIASSAISGTQHVITGLQPGSQYAMRVCAESPGGLLTAGITGSEATFAATSLTVIGNASAAADLCYQYFVERRDGASQPAADDIVALINLASDGDALFFSNSSCTAAITSVSIAPGASRSVFYVKNQTVETAEVRAVHSDSVPLSQSSINASFVAAFADVSTDAEITSGIVLSGFAVDDLNNDGYPDIFSPDASSQIQINDGDGTFSLGLAIITPGNRGVRTTDFDNDGDMDIITTNSATTNAGTKLRVHRNNGGAFTYHDSDIGLVNTRNLGDVGFLDIHHDGYIDFFAPNDSGPAGNEIYYNDGDGTFTSAGGNALGLTSYCSEKAMAADVNHDGHVDLFCKDTTFVTYIADGDGTFTESGAGTGLGIAVSEPYSGQATGDFNNDGFIDVVVSDGDGIFLFSNNGDGSFSDVTSAAGVSATGLGSGGGMYFGDIDNDGDLDLFVGVSAAGDKLFRNNGDGTFTDIAGSLGMDYSANPSHGGIFVDYDLDGDLDFLTGGSLRLYENKVDNDSYLLVRVVGLGGAGNSPVDGTGSKLELLDADDNFLAYREISGGEAYNSHGPKLQHFGLSYAWGGGSGTYKVRVTFSSGKVVTTAAIVPKDLNLTIGSTQIAGAIEIIEQ